MSKPQKYISALTSTTRQPEKAKNDPKKAKNEKVRKQKMLQNKIYQSY